MYIGKIIKFNSVTGTIVTEDNKNFIFTYTSLNDDVKVGDIVSFISSNNQLATDISLYKEKSIDEILDDFYDKQINPNNELKKKYNINDY